jgi:hypothetical protein
MGAIWGSPIAPTLQTFMRGFEYFVYGCAKRFG